MGSGEGFWGKFKYYIILFLVLLLCFIWYSYGSCCSSGCATDKQHSHMESRVEENKNKSEVHNEIKAKSVDTDNQQKKKE